MGKASHLISVSVLWMWSTVYGSAVFEFSAAPHVSNVQLRLDVAFFPEPVSAMTLYNYVCTDDDDVVCVHRKPKTMFWSISRADLRMNEGRTAPRFTRKKLRNLILSVPPETKRLLCLSS